ncbi:MAG: hypothetical protein ACKO18_01550 [Bacteroidota bacterium]
MNPLKQSALRRVIVWFLTLALLWPFGTQFLPSARAYASLNLHGVHALGQGTWDQAAAHAFPMDEQHHGGEDLEVCGEGAEGTEGIDDASEGDAFLSKKPRGIQALGLVVAGLWSRIGEKNLGIPCAKYLLYHTLRIPS